MKKLVFLASALALAACGGSDKSDEEGEEIISGTVTDEDGKKAEYSIRGDDDKGSFSIKTEDGSFSINAGNNSEAKLPFGLEGPADAEVMANVQMDQSGKGTSGSMISFETSKSPDQVVAALRKQAESAGFKVKTEINSEGTKMFSAQRGEGETLNVTASPQEGKGKTVANVIAGTKG